MVTLARGGPGGLARALVTDPDREWLTAMGAKTGERFALNRRTPWTIYSNWPSWPWLLCLGRGCLSPDECSFAASAGETGERFALTNQSSWDRRNGTTLWPRNETTLLGFGHGSLLLSHSRWRFAIASIWVGDKPAAVPSSHRSHKAITRTSVTRCSMPAASTSLDRPRVLATSAANLVSISMS